MSDPVSNAEIEDVLSSIRRLVSEEPSPLHKRRATAEAAKERFVLTPALRVEEEDEASGAEAEAEESVPAEPENDGASAAEAETGEPAPAEAEAAEVMEDDAGAAPLSEPADAAQPMARASDDQPADRIGESRYTLEQRIAELEAALQHSPEEWEPDGSEVDASQAPDIPGIADAPDAADDLAEPISEDVSPSDPLELLPAEAGESDGAEPVADGSQEDHAEAAGAEATGSEAAIDAPEAAEESGRAPMLLQRSPEEPADDPFAAWQEDALEDDDNLTQPDAGETGMAEAPEAARAEDMPAPEPDADAEAEPEEPVASIPHPDFEPADDAALQEPAEVRSRSEEAAEPQDEDVLEPASEPFGLEAARDAPEDDLADADAEASDGEAEPFGLFEEPAVMDEEALRDMVSQLVRDELQGVLGERITRNVRRLVRREIQRAIAMRELE